jgi:hypothetical protein
MVYVADSQSDTTDNPGFTQGIRIGSAKDGKVTAFIPMSSAELGAPEGVGVDDMGNVYGGWVTKMNMRRFVNSNTHSVCPTDDLGQHARARRARARGPPPTFLPPSHCVQR